MKGAVTVSTTSPRRNCPSSATKYPQRERRFGRGAPDQRGLCRNPILDLDDRWPV